MRPAGPAREQKLKLASQITSQGHPVGTGAPTFPPVAPEAPALPCPLFHLLSLLLPRIAPDRASKIETANELGQGGVSLHARSDYRPGAPISEGVPMPRAAAAPGPQCQAGPPPEAALTAKPLPPSGPQEAGRCPARRRGPGPDRTGRGGGRGCRWACPSWPRPLLPGARLGGLQLGAGECVISAWRLVFQNRS